MELCSVLQLGSTKFGSTFESTAALNYSSRPKLQLGLVHVKIDVWTRPKRKSLSSFKWLFKGTVMHALSKMYAIIKNERQLSFIEQVESCENEKINNSVFGANQTSKIIFKLNLNKAKTALFFNFNSPQNSCQDFKLNLSKLLNY